MIPGDLLSAFPHRQFHTLPGLLDSWAEVPNSNLNSCMPMQGGSLYHFYFGLWYDPAERRTHDLPCKGQTRYRLSQPDTVPQTQYTDTDLSLYYPLVWNVTLEYTVTHFNVLGKTRPGNPSPNAQVCDAVMVVVSRKLDIPFETDHRRVP